MATCLTQSLCSWIAGVSHYAWLAQGHVSCLVRSGFPGVCPVKARRRRMVGSRWGASHILVFPATGEPLRHLQRFTSGMSVCQRKCKTTRQIEIPQTSKGAGKTQGVRTIKEHFLLFLSFFFFNFLGKKLYTSTVTMPHKLG